MSTESAVKHTPGPWATEPARISDIGPVEFCTRIYATDPGPDCDFTVGLSRDADRSTRDANARLIAAAPAMLEALENAQIFIDYLCEISTLKNKSVRMLGGYQNIEAIIRKAKGE